MVLDVVQIHWGRNHAAPEGRLVNDRVARAIIFTQTHWADLETLCGHQDIMN